MNEPTQVTPERPRLVEGVGSLALIEAAEWLDPVQERAGVSLLARRQWLQSWAEAFSGWEPWLLAYVDESGVRAVAPLARRHARWGFAVVFAGDADLQESPAAHLDDRAAAALAAGLVNALHALGCPWTLSLRQLPSGSVLAAALLARLSTAVVSPGAARPQTRFVDDRAPEHWLTRNTRRALAKARNRISREGHQLQVQWLDSWSEIENVLPELLTVHRDRDLQLRGVTLLDDPAEARFHQAVIRRHSGHWRLLAVRIDDRLAAYALCLADGRTLRVWDNRVAPSWMRYSAGLIANSEVVMRAATDASIGAVDWGCGRQRYKSSMSSDVIEAENLDAWSSPLLRATLHFGSGLAAVPHWPMRAWTLGRERYVLQRSIVVLGPRGPDSTE